MHAAGRVHFGTVVDANHLNIDSSVMQYFLIPFLYDTQWKSNWDKIDKIVRHQDALTEIEVNHTSEFEKLDQQYELRGEVVDWEGWI